MDKFKKILVKVNDEITRLYNGFGKINEKNARQFLLTNYKKLILGFLSIVFVIAFIIGMNYMANEYIAKKEYINMITSYKKYMTDENLVRSHSEYTEIENIIQEYLYKQAAKKYDVSYTILANQTKRFGNMDFNKYKNLLDKNMIYAELVDVKKVYIIGKGKYVCSVKLTDIRMYETKEMPKDMVKDNVIYIIDLNKRQILLDYFLNQ